MVHFSFKMGKHPSSVDSRVLDRIRKNGVGWVFTPGDFVDLGSRVAVAVALIRHKKAGEIRQLARGLYDYPKTDPQFGQLSPSTEAIIAALKRHAAIRIQPTGAYAAHLLGLSTQVPMKLVFLTDGPNRMLHVGKQTLQFKRTTPRNMATSARITGLVIQALRYLGSRQIDDRVVEQLRQRLTDEDKNQLWQDLGFVPTWMLPVFQKLVAATVP